MLLVLELLLDLVLLLRRHLREELHVRVHVRYGEVVVPACPGGGHHRLAVGGHHSLRGLW